MRRIAVLDAPSNLGLRPPTPTSVPGCAKAPGALRDQGLLRRLNARDAGCLTPPRYDPGDWRPGDGVSHAAEISAYSRKLADRIGAILDLGEFPVVLGGDCSIVLGSALAMNRLGEAVGGRIGLVFVDGHSDFRHPGNASYVGAAAGEDLALVTGRGQTDLAAMEGRRPYYRDIDVVVMGIRAQDEYRLDLQAAGIVTRPVPTLRVEGAARSAQWARDQLVDCAGYWVHIDVDVLDPAVMPAVDAPEPGGIAFPELEILLAGLVESPHCLGVEITVFDPDYDPDGRYAEEITSAVVAGLKPALLVDARPDLVAARRDLAGPGRLGRIAARSGLGSVPAARSAVERDSVEAQRAMVAEDGARLAAAAAAASASEAAGSSFADPVADVDPGPVDSELVDSELVDSESVDSELVDPESVDSELVDSEPVDPDPVDLEPVDFEPVDGVVVMELRPADHAEEFAEEFAEPEVHAEVMPGAEALAEPEREPQAEDLAEPEAQAEDLAEAEVGDIAEPESRADDLADLEIHTGPVTEAEPGGDLEPVDHTGPELGPIRPLGSAPLLDSKPLPATMPGMLRPRAIEDFSLPAQRPAFEVGPEQPADLG